jgi:hypothetical protein
MIQFIKSNNQEHIKREETRNIPCSQYHNQLLLHELGDSETILSKFLTGNLFNNLENNLQELHLKVVEYLPKIWLNENLLYNFRPNDITFDQNDSFTKIKISIFFDKKGEFKSRYVDSDTGYVNKWLGPRENNVYWTKVNTLHEITTKQQIIDSNFKIHKVGGFLLYCEKSQIEELLLLCTERTERERITKERITRERYENEENVGCQCIIS